MVGHGRCNTQYISIYNLKNTPKQTYKKPNIQTPKVRVCVGGLGKEMMCITKPHLEVMSQCSSQRVEKFKRTPVLKSMYFKPRVSDSVCLRGDYFEAMVYGISQHKFKKLRVWGEAATSLNEQGRSKP